MILHLSIQLLERTRLPVSHKVTLKRLKRSGSPASVTTFVNNSHKRRFKDLRTLEGLLTGKRVRESEMKNLAQQSGRLISPRKHKDAKAHEVFQCHSFILRDLIAEISDQYPNRGLLKNQIHKLI